METAITSLGTIELVALFCVGFVKCMLSVVVCLLLLLCHW